MRSWTALAVRLAFSVPATAQPPRASEPGEGEVLELGQDVDKTLLREGMLELGRSALIQTTGQEVPDEVRKRYAVEVEALKEFIAVKTDAFTWRSDELKAKRAELAKAATRPRAATAGRAEAAPDDRERQGLV